MCCLIDKIITIDLMIYKNVVMIKLEVLVVQVIEGLIFEEEE